MTNDPLTRLPKEVLKLVLSFLRVRDLTTMMQTSKNNKEFIKRNFSSDFLQELESIQNKILIKIKEKISIYDTTGPQWELYPVSKSVNVASLIQQLQLAVTLSDELIREFIDILDGNLELTDDLNTQLVNSVNTGVGANIINIVDNSKNIRKTQLLENHEYNSEDSDPETILYGTAETDAENLKFILCELIKLRKIKEVMIEYKKNLENVNQPETNSIQLKL